MIETDATIADRTYMIVQDLHDELPSLGTFASQAAVVGGFMGFVSLAISMIVQSQSGYNFFLLFYLLPMVIAGMFYGAFEGSIIWACTRSGGHQLPVVLRGCIGIGVHVFLITLTGLLAPRYTRFEGDSSTIMYLYGIWTYIGYGLLLGLVTGSRFEPWYELFRGTTRTPWRCMASGLTGLALRPIVIIGFMESVLYLIWEQQSSEIRSQYIAVIAVVHFIAAGVIVFARMPNWLLLQLALVVNFPVLLFITDVLTPDSTPMRVLSFIYLGIWFAFLFTRLSNRVSTGSGSDLVSDQ
jgi:hypothetical protein